MAPLIVTNQHSLELSGKTVPDPFPTIIKKKKIGLATRDYSSIVTMVSNQHLATDTNHLLVNTETECGLVNTAHHKCLAKKTKLIPCKPQKVVF